MMQKAKACRMHTPCVPRIFEQALACRTQHHPTLTTEEIADRAEVSVRRLHRWSNENEPHEQIPARVLVRICVVTGAWDLIDFLVEPHGLRLVSTVRSDARDLLREAADLPVAVGRAFEAVTRITRDGVVDEDEACELREHTRNIRREADDLDSALANMRRRA